MKLGVHCSTSGGAHNAFNQATDLEIDTFQIFTRNQRQWKAKPIASEEKEAFQSAWNPEKVDPIFSHCSYLINLASADPDIHFKSTLALKEEVDRCSELGLSFCVLHPGAAGTQERDVAFRKVTESLSAVLELTPASKVKILLEITAGQGSSLGGSIEDLATITRNLDNHSRIGYCVDTCHAFAAGYDIRTTAGMEDFLATFDRLLGVKNIDVFHLNDSKGTLGSHLDRHDHIGKGQLGLEPFRYIMQHFPDIPKVLETPKEDDMDKVNLEVLRSLA